MRTDDMQEVLGLERRFWDAMRNKDGRIASQMTDDNCIIVGAQGVSTVDPGLMEKLTVEGEWTLEEYAFDEQRARARMIGEDIAIVAYPVSERVVVDGQTLPVKAHDASVWVRRDGEWRCALHTESLAGDPFGRDRVAPPEGGPAVSAPS
jgi:hypothetical protein